MTTDELKYKELLARGRELTPDERREHIRKLARSPFFAALVVEFQETWEQFAADLSEQKMANHRGSLEHCAGSMHALKVIVLGKLKAALKLPKQPAPPEQG